MSLPANSKSKSGLNPSPNEDQKWNQTDAVVRSASNLMYRQEDSQPPNRSTNPPQPWAPDDDSTCFTSGLEDYSAITVPKIQTEFISQQQSNHVQAHRQASVRSASPPHQEESEGAAQQGVFEQKSNIRCPSPNKYITGGKVAFDSDQQQGESRIEPVQFESGPGFIDRSRYSNIIKGNPSQKKVCVPLGQTKFFGGTQPLQRYSPGGRQQYGETKMSDRPEFYGTRVIERPQYGEARLVEQPQSYEGKVTEQTQYFDQRKFNQPQYYERRTGERPPKQYFTSDPCCDVTSNVTSGFSNHRISTRKNNYYLGQNQSQCNLSRRNSRTACYLPGQGLGSSATPAPLWSGNENIGFGNQMQKNDGKDLQRSSIINFIESAACAQDKLFRMITCALQGLFPVVTVVTTGVLAFLIILFMIQLLVEVFSSKCVFWKTGCRL